MTEDGSPTTRTKLICLLAAGVTSGLVVTMHCAHADPHLPALNSYAQPPFVPVSGDRTDGLAKTFVELVNKTMDGQPAFLLENMPRRRLDLVLNGHNFSGIALFLAPEFLVESAQHGGAWSEPVMVDENLIVSLRPLDISSLNDLHGLKFGGVAGHIYRLLGTLVENGQVQREDAPDHISNLRKLCLGRVDFVVISKSEFAGTTPHVSCPEAFRPTAFPEPQLIVRRVLVRIAKNEDAREVLDAVAKVACGRHWTEALAAYGLSTVGCRTAVARSNDAQPAKTRKSRPLSRPDEQRS